MRLRLLLQNSPWNFGGGWEGVFCLEDATVGLRRSSPPAPPFFGKNGGEEDGGAADLFEKWGKEDLDIY
jgi:hypothetical protein